MFNKGWGALNGILVFLAAVPFTLWLVGQDLGALAGSLGNLAQLLNSAWAMLLGIAAATLAGLLATRGELTVDERDELTVDAREAGAGQDDPPPVADGG